MDNISGNAGEAQPQQQRSVVRRLSQSLTRSTKNLLSQSRRSNYEFKAPAEIGVVEIERDNNKTFIVTSDKRTGVEQQLNQRMSIHSPSVTARHSIEHRYSSASSQTTEIRSSLSGTTIQSPVQLIAAPAFRSNSNSKQAISIARRCSSTSVAATTAEANWPIKREQVHSSAEKTHTYDISAIAVQRGHPEDSHKVRPHTANKSFALLKQHLSDSGENQYTNSENDIQSDPSAKGDLPQLHISTTTAKSAADGGKICHKADMNQQKATTLEMFSGLSRPLPRLSAKDDRSRQGERRRSAFQAVVVPPATFDNAKASSISDAQPKARQEASSAAYSLSRTSHTSTLSSPHPMQNLFPLSNDSLKGDSNSLPLRSLHPSTFLSLYHSQAAQTQQGYNSNSYNRNRSQPDLKLLSLQASQSTPSHWLPPFPSSPDFMRPHSPARAKRRGKLGRAFDRLSVGLTARRKRSLSSSAMDTYNNFISDPNDPDTITRRMMLDPLWRFRYEVNPPERTPYPDLPRIRARHDQLTLPLTHANGHQNMAPLIIDPAQPGGGGGGPDTSKTASASLGNSLLLVPSHIRSPSDPTTISPSTTSEAAAYTAAHTLSAQKLDTPNPDRISEVSARYTPREKPRPHLDPILGTIQDTITPPKPNRNHSPDADNPATVPDISVYGYPMVLEDGVIQHNFTDWGEPKDSFDKRYDQFPENSQGTDTVASSVSQRSLNTMESVMKVVDVSDSGRPDNVYRSSRLTNASDHTDSDYGQFVRRHTSGNLTGAFPRLEGMYVHERRNVSRPSPSMTSSGKGSENSPQIREQQYWGRVSGQGTSNNLVLRNVPSDGGSSTQNTLIPSSGADAGSRQHCVNNPLPLPQTPYTAANVNSRPNPLTSGTSNSKVPTESSKSAPNSQSTSTAQNTSGHKRSHSLVNTFVQDILRRQKQANDEDQEKDEELQILNDKNAMREAIEIVRRRELDAESNIDNSTASNDAAIISPRRRKSLLGKIARIGRSKSEPRFAPRRFSAGKTGFISAIRSNNHANVLSNISRQYIVQQGRELSFSSSNPRPSVNAPHWNDNNTEPHPSPSVDVEKFASTDPSLPRAESKASSGNIRTNVSQILGEFPFVTKLSSGSLSRRYTVSASSPLREVSEKVRTKPRTDESDNIMITTGHHPNTQEYKQTVAKITNIDHLNNRELLPPVGSGKPHSSRICKVPQNRYLQALTYHQHRIICSNLKAKIPTLLLVSIRFPTTPFLTRSKPSTLLGLP